MAPYESNSNALPNDRCEFVVLLEAQTPGHSENDGSDGGLDRPWVMVFIIGDFLPFFGSVNQSIDVDFLIWRAVCQWGKTR